MEINSLSVRIIGILLALCICLCVITGCSNSETGGFSPNTWYTYKDDVAISCSNCMVSASSVLGSYGNRMVTYYPVCKNCLEPAATPKMGGVSPNYPKTESYYCDNCSTVTVVYIKVAQ